MIKTLVIGILVWISLGVEAANETQSLINQIKAQTVDPDKIDLSILKFSGAPEESLKVIHKWANDNAINQYYDLKGLQHESHPQYCIQANYYNRLINNLRLLNRSESAEAYRRDKKATFDAIDYIVKDMEQHANELADKEHDPLAKQIAYYWLMDRFSKTKSQFLFEHKMDEKLSDASWYYLQEQMKIVMCEKDYATAKWLETELSQIDWVNRSTYGATTDDRAALLVTRHYDHDFVEATLWRLERLSLKEETTLENVNLVKKHLSFTNAQSAAILEQFGQDSGPAFMCN